MILEPHILYINEKPRAIVMAKDEAHAIESYRLARLGQTTKETDAVRALSAWDAPIDDVLRIGMLGLYQRMFSADMMMAAAQDAAGKKH